MEWVEVKSDEDIDYINKKYDNFEDAFLVEMNYVSGDYVDNELMGYMQQKNDLRLVFQRLDRNPFSIELWFTNAKRINMFFANLQDNCLSDILYAKVCRNKSSFFWTVWEDFDPYNEEHLRLNDVKYVEGYRLKWRIIEE